MPVRERLLLILPDKEIFDYLCTGCGSSVGQREVTAGEKIWPSIIDQVRADDLVTVGAQHVDDVAGPTARVPELRGQPLDTQQRLNRDLRRLVKIVATLAQRVLEDETGHCSPSQTMSSSHARYLRAAQRCPQAPAMSQTLR